MIVYAKKIPQAFKSMREARGKSLRDATAESGVSCATLCRIENGKEATVGNLIRVAKWMQMEVVLIDRPARRSATQERE